MDDAVRTALAKWPNVPACYGWLALDRRGCWRLGQDRSERVRHAGLAAFLGRNYSVNEQGAWYCQNGPQRVYVTLECCPFVVRSVADGEFTSQTGAVFDAPDSAWIDADGSIYLGNEQSIALLDDRDLPLFLDKIITAQGHSADDEQILALCRATPDATPLYLVTGKARLSLQPTTLDALTVRFRFLRTPSPTE